MTTPDAAYSKRWRYDRDHGVKRTVPAAPVRAHVQALLDAGWSQRAIGDAAGLGGSTVNHVMRNGCRVRRVVADALLAVTDETILARSNPRGFVRRVGATRRVQALLAIGWRHEDITAQMRAAGTGCRVWSQLVLSQRGAWINRATHGAVVYAYEQLSMQAGPSARTRSRAVKAGFAPPLAWDDTSIDDPAATLADDIDHELLDEVAIEEAMRGRSVRLTRAERGEAVRRLTERGYSAAEIGERLGISDRHVQRHRSAA